VCCLSINTEDPEDPRRTAKCPTPPPTILSPSLNKQTTTKKILFNLEKPVVLSVEQFDTYWPLTDAMWSNRMVRKGKKTGPTLRKKKAGW
jgi:hypothetical protein